MVLSLEFGTVSAQETHRFADNVETMDIFNPMLTAEGKCMQARIVRAGYASYERGGLRDMGRGGRSLFVAG